MSRNLSRATLDSLDEEIFEYNSIAREIAVRKIDLDTQNDYDENVGGGKTNRISRVVEDTVIRYDKDSRIRYLTKLRKDIEQCYQELTDDQKEIFDMRWLLDESNDWPYIAEKKHWSNKTIYRKREAILIKYAKIKGKL